MVPSVIITKRIIDILGSLTVLIVLAPILILIAIWIKIDSHGPVFYRQQRIKKCTRHLSINDKFRPKSEDVFHIIKFRTMKHEEEDIPKPCISDDDRITRVGKFLRPSRLDEIPNFINVLMGDMSIVGPRAEWVELYYQIEDEFPNIWERTRYIKPGITGEAQLELQSNGALDLNSKLAHALSINDINEHENGVRFKLYYDFAYALKLSSFWSFIKTDFAIMLKTPYVMFFRRNVI